MSTGQQHPTEGSKPLSSELDITHSADAVHAFNLRAAHFALLAGASQAADAAKATEFSELFTLAADVVERLNLTGTG